MASRSLFLALVLGSAGTLSDAFGHSTGNAEPYAYSAGVGYCYSDLHAGMYYRECDGACTTTPKECYDACVTAHPETVNANHGTSTGDGSAMEWCYCNDKCTCMANIGSTGTYSSYGAQGFPSSCIDQGRDRQYKLCDGGAASGAKYCFLDDVDSCVETVTYEENACDGEEDGTTWTIMD